MRSFEEIVSVDPVKDPNACSLELELLLDQYEWFHSCVVENGRITVYVEHMDQDVLTKVPEKLFGHNVFVAFSAHLFCSEKYRQESVVDLANQSASK